MSLAEVGDFIGSVGFPIAVAAWLLWRIDPLLRRLLAALELLAASGVLVCPLRAEKGRD